MRVFSALFPPDEVVEDFSRAVDPLRRRYPQLEWTPPLLWHMTLTFFGNLSLEDSHRLGKALGAFADAQAPFPVRIDGAGATPNILEGETLFATLDTPGNSLLELYLGNISAVQGFGWVLDRRKFRPHFPLARSEQPFDFTELVAQVSEYQSKVWEVSSLALVWARPGDDGRPYFELLGEHRFKGEPVAPPAVEPAMAPARASLHLASVAPLPRQPVTPSLPQPAPASLPQHPTPPVDEPVPSEPCPPATVDW